MSFRFITHSVLLVFILVLAGCPVRNTPQTVETQPQTITKSRTVTITPVVTGVANLRSNVRQDASSKSKITDVVTKGSQVVVTGKKGNWYEIRKPEATEPSGYVFHKLIEFDFGNYQGIAASNKAATQIYSASSSDSKVVGNLPAQSQFDLIGIENGYYRVRGEGIDGFVPLEVCVADPDKPIAKTMTVTEQVIVNNHTELPAEVKAAQQEKTFSKTTVKSSTSATASTSKSVPAATAKQSSSAGSDFFSAFASALLGTNQNTKTKSKSQVPVTSENDVMKEILMKLSVAKELALKTAEIRKEMLTSLSETRALQSVVGSTIASMQDNYRIAADTAKGVSSTGMKKIDIQAFVKDLSYDQTESIESASVKIANNGQMLRLLEDRIKIEADAFSKLNQEQYQNMGSIIDAFSSNIHASNALYNYSMEKSGDIILSIDRAIKAYEDKAGPLTVEATKQLGVLALITVELVAQINQVQQNPIVAITLLPRLYQLQEQLTELTTMFNDFIADYNYIEENSQVINEQSKKIGSIIMTARRKNTQITTQLEAYYKQKMEISKRLEKSFAKKSEETFKAASAKAAKESFKEEELS